MILFRFMQYPLQVETDRPGFTLRQLSSQADDDAYFEAVTANPEHLSQFGDTTALKYQEIEAVVQARKNPGRALRMGMWDNGEFVGFIKATPDDEGKEAEIGYWVDNRHGGNGYAAIGARALATHVAMQYPRVFAEVIEGNVASSKSLENAGFVQTAEQAGKLIFEFMPIG
jgi:RimJ/RimL family protein N-acetyltransferase